jgi:membrane associated rhomboid family serine protease
VGWVERLFPLHDENRPASKPFVNYILIIINIVIFFFFFLQGWNPLEKAILNFGVIPIDILNGERLWTLFTSIFMHADIMHIFGNMLYLWVFGDNIEDSLGHGKYILFYLVGGVLASLTHILMMLVSGIISPSSDLIPYFIYSLNTPSVGASGAISAVLGAYLLLYPRARIRTLVFYFLISIISVPAFFYLGFWFIYQFLMGIVSLTGFSSGVAFWAHIGGFFFGIIGIKGFNVKSKRKKYIKEQKMVKPFIAPWVQTPLVDIIVDPDRVIVLAMLPGIKREDIRINLSKLKIEISAKREELKYFKRIVLPVSVIPVIEKQVYREGMLKFIVKRILS